MIRKVTYFLVKQIFNRLYLIFMYKIFEEMKNDYKIHNKIIESGCLIIRAH